MEPEKPDSPKPNARGVQDPHRKVLIREPQLVLRLKHWQNFTDDSLHDLQLVIDSREHTVIAAEKLTTKWLWLMEDDPIQQVKICKWRASWLKNLKKSQCGIGRDTTLLPAAWSRIHYILNNRPSLLTALPRHAATIINVDTSVIAEDVWTDLIIDGPQIPVDGTACFVYRQRTMNKPAICRSWRSLHQHRFSWEIPPIDTYIASRCLPSRRPDAPVEYMDYLGQPFSNTAKCRVQPNLISKKSTRLDIEITRV